MDTPLYSVEQIPEDFEAPGGHAWAEFRKTTTTRAIRIDGTFRVLTIHGGEPQECSDGWLALDSEGHPYPIDEAVFSATFEPIGGTETKKVSAGELFERLAEYVTKNGGGSIAAGLDENGKEWMSSVIFGREAPDSPMAGGAAHGVGALDEALFQAASECGLTVGTELKPTVEQELREAENHIESLLRRDKVSATDIVTDETAARKWLSAR